jgi:hypothetical protein
MLSLAGFLYFNRAVIMRDQPPPAQHGNGFRLPSKGRFSGADHSLTRLICDLR